MKTADILLVIDVQKGVCEGIFRRSEWLSQINQRIAAYRAAEKPICFIQHNEIGLEKGTSDWELVPELAVQTGDYFVNKTHANGFYKTELQNLLAELSVKSIEYCGAQTEFCVNTTVVFAHGLAYENVMCHGATSTFDNDFLSAEQTIDFYENHLWQQRFLEFLN
ncbi:cysteine hydrolase family protein [Lactococcus kimchii]|uniref:cysteine hydrolase family protein n=1 Tax=Lactococcus sp. S-13 TaxID=2507158 RepID=UPI001023C033|nr:cysteine hydrolase family protein [Lactococcus sp. S-13]RZI49213.1 cysteine hydrolase [Lactococcus sp. S-13]